MKLDLSQAVSYHDGKFPPATLDYERLLPPLLAATDALARYDQMLQSMHNNEIFLAPLRNQEAVLSSRMEGTISTMDEVLQFEANHSDILSTETRSDVIETIFYHRTLKNTIGEI